MISRRERKLLYVLSILLWLWALQGVVRLYRDLQTAKGELRSLEHLEGTATESVANTELRLYFSRLLALEGRGLPWPEKAAGVNLLDYLRRQAQRAGLSVRRMSLEPAQKKGAHRRLQVQLDLAGSADRFVAFLHSLAQGEYACNVVGLELAGEEGQLGGRVGLEFFLLDNRALSQAKQALISLGAQRGGQLKIKPLAYYFPEKLKQAFILQGSGKVPVEVAQEPPSVAPLPQEAIPWPQAPKAETPAKETPEPQIAPPQEPEPAYRPSYQLTGIVYQEGRPMAVLASSEGGVEVVAEGAKLAEGQVVEKIEPKGVILRRGNQKARLEVAK